MIKAYFLFNFEIKTKTMKHLFSFLLCISIGSALFAQSKEIIFQLNHKYNGSEFTINEGYLVDGTTPIEFSRMEYYLHINQVTNSLGISMNFNENTYILVNPSQNEYNIGSHEVSDVNKLFFHLGVSPEVNHNDPTLLEASHPLAPQNPSMHWGWAAGYRFIAIEAMVDKNEDGILETVLNYHVVDDSYYTSLDITDAAVETETSITFFIDVNYDKMFENINTSEGGNFHGVYDENLALVNNIATNNVFTVSENLNLTETIDLNGIFPNPFTNVIQLNLNQNSRVKLFNVLGDLIEIHDFNKGPQHIKTEQLTNGVYILSIENKNTSKTIKLLKR